MPKITVVVPAYNVEQYIEDCLDSISGQTYDDYEVIVVNDGSTDATLSRAESKVDRRVRVVTQLNRGLAGARNTGVRLAKGEFVAFLDSDDRWHPEKLARHVAHLESDETIGVSYSQSRFIDAVGSPMSYFQKPKLKNVSARDVFLRNPVGNGSAPVIRMKALLDIAFSQHLTSPAELSFFDESFRQSEDIECWVRIALSTRWKFEGIGLPLTEYRVNDGGLSAALDRQLASWERMVEKARAIDPQFVELHLGAARAYQYRYLARRAIRSGDPASTWDFLGKALRSHPAIMVEEPYKTLVTLLAASLASLIPQRLYRQMEAMAMRLEHRAVKSSQA